MIKAGGMLLLESSGIQPVAVWSSEAEGGTGTSSIQTEPDTSP